MKMIARPLQKNLTKGETFQIALARLMVKSLRTSFYFNHKLLFSIVLMSIVHEFIMVDVGTSGRDSDGELFYKYPVLYKRLVKNEL